jgi:hypothetical protein
MASKTYFTKDDALKTIKGQERLFGYDVIREYGKIVKRYFNSTYEEIKKILKENRHIYEYYGYLENQKIKLFVDLDYKLNEEHELEYETKEEMLKKIIDTIDKYLKEKKIYDEEKIILDSSDENKYSYHIIYPNIVFSDVQNLKNFMIEMEEKSIGFQKNIPDMCVYRNGCFRCINQSKIGKKSVLKSTKDIDILNTLLLYTDKENTIRWEKVNKNNKVINNIKPTDLMKANLEKKVIKMDKNLVKELLNALDLKRFDNYESWRNILFCLKCENTNGYYEIFDEINKKSKFYDGKKNMELWNNYDANKSKNKYTYNSLLYWTKCDNIEKYNEICEKYNIYEKENTEIKMDNVLNINQEYLLPGKKINNCTISKYLLQFLNSDNIKSLMISSPYNTGKTTLLSNICVKFKRILFISYRITLSNNLYGTFKGLNFELYNNNINADRLICQVDSIHKINDLNFDLVIMDESESILNHYFSKSLKNPHETFQIMSSICLNTKKVIALDGDLGNRTKSYIKALGESLYINNIIVKDKRKFVFCNNEKIFEEDIEKNLKLDKNICIVSMSEKEANRYYNLFSENYRTQMYTSKTDDNDKKLLSEVRKIWSSLQLVIYSPSIESGVDYDIEHFDKTYVIMSPNSTSQRGLFQMIHRVRKLKDSEIKCLLNGILPNQTTFNRHYTFEEIKAFYKDLIEDELNFTLNEENKLVIENKEKFDIYDIIMMYNKLEYLNKNINCFLPIFIKMLKEKGHEYVILNEEKTKKDNELNYVMDKIINAKEITSDEYKILVQKQANHSLTENEKYQITKYMYTVTFDTKFDNIEKLKMYYNRLQIIKNAKILLDDKNIKLNDSKIKNKEHIKRIIETRNILKELGIDISRMLNDTITINRNDLIDKMSKFNEIMTQNKILFGLSKNTQIDTSNKFFGTLKTLLNNFGIKMENNKTSKRMNGQKNNINTYKFNFESEVRNKINEKVIDIFEYFSS